MIQAIKISFEEYLSLDASADLPEGWFEYCDGELRRLPGVLEYWLIDPQQKTVTILTLQAAVYTESISRGVEPIVSAQFPELTLSAEQILSAGE